MDYKAVVGFKVDFSTIENIISSKKYEDVTDYISRIEKQYQAIGHIDGYHNYVVFAPNTCDFDVPQNFYALPITPYTQLACQLNIENSALIANCPVPIITTVES